MAGDNGHFLLIETRSSWESGEVVEFLETASQLATQGDSVTLFLIQNAVLMARRGLDSPLAKLLGKVEILADRYSLEGRNLTPAALCEGVRAAEMDRLISLMVDLPTKIIWH